MRKLGINCGNYKGLDPIESIPYIKDAGFDCVFSGYTPMNTRDDLPKP